jgi:hypothetical protein
MTTPRPTSAEEAVTRALSMVGVRGAYQLGTGDFRQTWISGKLIDLPWTERESDHAIGSDCAGFAIAWCYKLRRHRPGYCKGATNFDDVEDDINVNSVLEDATGSAPDLFQLATGLPKPGDLLCYPTFRLPTVPLPFIGHVGIVTSAARVTTWDASAPRYDLLDVAQCCGPDGRAPAVIATDGSHWSTHAQQWPKPQHTVYVLRAIP